MSKYIRSDKQLLVAAFGITTSLLTGTTLGLIEVYFGYAIYSWTFWLVIPAGAVLSGFGAASGYYAGAMLFHQKPAGGILFNMVSASISAFLLVHYIPYFLLNVDGIRIKEAISFWQYMDIDIRNTSLNFSVRGRNISTVKLDDFWGYAYAGLQLLGFSLGGFSLFGWLLQNPYCDNCSRYLKKIGSQQRYTSNGEIFIHQIKNFTWLLDARKFNEAIKYHAENMGYESSNNHHLSSIIVTSLCAGCGINHLYFIISKLTGNSWKDINETEIRLFTEEQLKLEGMTDTNQMKINQ